MKKKHFFTFACVMALMSGFVSCTNEDFEDVYTQDLQQKTRAARNGMTKEDVLARLDEIGEKYGVNVNMLYVRDYAEFTESTFEKIEQKIIADMNRGADNDIVNSIASESCLLDDCEIDEYRIATSSTNVEASDNYDFFIDFSLEYRVPSEYSSNSSHVLSYQVDEYEYRYGLNLREYDLDVMIESYLTDLSGNVNQYGQTKKSSCQVGGFRNDAISRSYDGCYYFDFEFDIYASHVKYYHNTPVNSTTKGSVYGTYNNGLQYIWGMASDYNLVINLPDLN